MATRPDANESPRPSAPAGRVPPHDLQAEESLLGAMMLSTEAIAGAAGVVNASDFYKPAHGHVYDAIHTLYASGQPADSVTVSDELRRAGLLEAIGGPAVLAQIMSSTPATTNAARYARIVEEYALLRRLIGVAGEISELGYSVPDDVAKALDRAEAMVYEVNERRVTDSTKRVSDLLSDNLDRLEKLYEQGDTVTGTPTGYIDLDQLLSGLQPSSLVVVGARPAMGKCVAWDTPIVDPLTGAVRTAAALHRVGERGDAVRVMSLDADHRLAVTAPSAFVDDGHKPVFRVRTRLGREVRTTASHPFLTPEGWRPLVALSPGDVVAVPSGLAIFGGDSLPDVEVSLLGYLTGAPSGVSTSAAPPLAEGSPGVVARLQQRHRLGGAAEARRVPEAVYRLPRHQLATYLNRVLAAAATIAPPSGHDDAGRLRLPLASARLAQDLQHLFLRFGINAAVGAPSGGLGRRVLEVSDAEDLARLAGEIGILGQQILLDDLVARARLAARLVPAGTGETGALALERPQGVVRWDEIVAIEAEGSEQVYDLTIPGLHNFVAADVFVHNTSFALGMVAHAALEAQKPVLMFSLEMSNLELSQRLICSEARVDAARIRNGQLQADDWSKISRAMGRLADAPIWIDDNPHLTIMEIRAKARRLKSQIGSLGMIVIDYLQLMSGRSNAENRQVEVSELSRGLKILARELETPVVALSQLSRGLEMRTDKRPMLADLRESGSIEQDSDVVIFIFREEIYDAKPDNAGTAEIIVAKHRSGPTGVVQLAFLPQYTLFANMAKGFD
ncbi:MAG: replicative DNA helicase [Acidimicrobiia bacterium]|nr:replicative DNA helicase [Acidimicrobiia bacterium]